jgi:beta-phosphoglucomutase
MGNKVHNFSKVPKYNNLKKVHPKLKAIFWDMDGTLVDTERCHAYAIHKTIQKQRPDYEMSLENTFKYIIGLTDHTVYKHLIQDEILVKMTWDEFIEIKDIEFFKYIKDIKIENVLKPGIIDLLDDCQKNGTALALVTSSEKNIAEYILDTFHLTHYFKVILTREDTKLNKPHPAPYLAALKLTDLNIEDAIIFEDSLTGMEAAKLSGITYYHVSWY